MLVTAILLASSVAAAEPAARPAIFYAPDTRVVYAARQVSRCADAKVITASGPALLRPQDRADLKVRRLGDLPLGRFCALGGPEKTGGSR